MVVDWAMDEPLASCMIVHFSDHISKWVWSDISYIYYFLPWFTVSCMKLMIFYFIITFSYTKYFVNSYTVDLVFTLSYHIPQSKHKTLLFGIKALLSNVWNTACNLEGSGCIKHKSTPTVAILPVDSGSRCFHGSCLMWSYFYWG